MRTIVMKLIGPLAIASLAIVCACSTSAPMEKTEKAQTADAPKLPPVPPQVEPAKNQDAKSQPCDCGKEADSDEKKQTELRAKWEKHAREISDSPFELSITSAWLTGECARGPVPEKRDNTGGIRVKMTGKLTYTGSDLLMEAALDGALVIDAAGTHVVEIPFQFDGDRRPATTMPRMVRGADPWVAGQSREFQLETLPLSEAFCEFVPKATTLYVVLNTFGARNGKLALPVAAVPIHFEEVVGMALDSQVQLIEDNGFVPAAGHAAVMDKMLVTLLDGTTKWVPRERVAYLNGISRSPGAGFPNEISAGDWLISVKGISSSREFEDISPQGEDAFLALIEVTITNKGEETLPVEDIRMRLETAPNEWRRPLDAGLGKPGDRKLAAGESIDATAAFIRYRFERPTRLKVDVAGSGSVYINVFSYDIGPERSPVKN